MLASENLLQLPRDLPALPDVRWRLDDQGHLLDSCSAPDPLRTALPAGPLGALLTPAHRVLWELTLWPSLKSCGALDEIALDLQLGSCATPVLTFWRAAPGPGGQAYTALVVPALERTRLVTQLRQARDSLESMPGAILQIELQGQELRFPYASGGLLDLLGVTCTQAMGNPALLMERLDDPSRRALLDALSRAEDSAAANWLVVLQSRREPRRHIEVSASRQIARGPWHAVLTDVSERERLLAEMTRRAETDELTMLLNRRGLLAQMEARLREHRAFAVLFMDCDRFKQINDSLGHDAGDALLEQVARRLRGSLRAADALSAPISLGLKGTLAARLGGDEFVILADEVRTKDEVRALADRLVKLMTLPYQMGAHEMTVSASIGVVLADGRSQPGDLLRDADTAMYEAKKGGRGRWVLFEQAMHETVANAMSMEHRLRRALSEGHVRAAFQPVVEIASGRIVGFEALARWQDEELGDIRPDRFIRVAEDSGQICELGEQVLEDACQHFAQWRALGLTQGRRLSVNMSWSQLSDVALPERIEALLACFGMPAQELQLEITESLTMAGDGPLHKLHRLRELGLRLSLDDFGTGYSSLSALHRLPVQQLKLDRSFIGEIGGSAYHLAVVRAALQVAQALELEVVAEGVETREQALALSALGCQLAQGWLYAPAVSPAEAQRLLQLPRMD